MWSIDVYVLDALYHVVVSRHSHSRLDVSSANLTAATLLSLRFSPDLCLIESGGDNLAANYSRELADYIIYVIDVAGGDKVPRKVRKGDGTAPACVRQGHAHVR